MIIANLFFYSSDFETRLYLCHDGFGFMGLWELDHLTGKTALLPFYIVAQSYFILFVLASWLNKKVSYKE